MTSPTAVIVPSFPPQKGCENQFACARKRRVTLKRQVKNSLPISCSVTVPIVMVRNASSGYIWPVRASIRRNVPFRELSVIEKGPRRLELVLRRSPGPGCSNKLCGLCLSTLAFIREESGSESMTGMINLFSKCSPVGMRA